MTRRRQMDSDPYTQKRLKQHGKKPIPKTEKELQDALNKWNEVEEEEPEQEAHGGGSGVSGRMKTMHHNNYCTAKVCDGKGSASQQKTFKIFLSDNAISTSTALTGVSYNAWNIDDTTDEITQVAPSNMLHMQQRKNWATAGSENWDTTGLSYGPLEYRLIVPNCISTDSTGTKFDLPKNKDNEYYALANLYHNTDWFNVPLNNVKNYVDDSVWGYAFKNGATKYRFKKCSVTIHGYYPQSQYQLGTDLVNRQYSNGHLIIATPEGYQWPTDNPALNVDFSGYEGATFKDAAREIPVNEMNNAQPSITFTSTSIRERRQFQKTALWGSNTFQGPWRNTLIPLQIPINWSVYYVDATKANVITQLKALDITEAYNAITKDDDRETVLQSLDSRGDTFHVMDEETYTHDVKLGDHWVNLCESPEGQGVGRNLVLRYPTNVDHQNSSNAQTFNQAQYRSNPINYVEESISTTNENIYTGDRIKKNIQHPININPLYVKISRHPQDTVVQYSNQAYLHLTYSCEIEFTGPDVKFSYDSKIYGGAFDYNTQSYTTDSAFSMLYNATVKSNPYDMDNEPRNIYRPTKGTEII